MKDKLRYEYHIEVDNLIIKEDYGMFYLNDKYFYFTKIRRQESEINDLLKLYMEMQEKGYLVNFIVPTINGSLTTVLDNDTYALVSIDSPLEEYSIIDMLKKWDMMKIKNFKSSLYRPRWSILWSEKIDYFEYQISNLGKEKPIVLNTFGYFVGLTENAISYVERVNNYIKPTNILINVCHRRVWYPNYRLNYDNPLHFIIDLEVRDVAEYLKGEALESLDDALIDLKCYLDMRRIDLYSLGMLYGRLMYPSYYFDIYDNVMNYDVSDECLEGIIDKIPVIEEFLRKSYLIIREYGSIESVDWLMKKEAIS